MDAHPAYQVLDRWRRHDQLGSLSGRNLHEPVNFRPTFMTWPRPEPREDAGRRPPEAYSCTLRAADDRGRRAATGIGHGARYIGRGTSNTTQVFAALNEGGAFTYTSVVRIHNVIQGSADNDVLVVHVKWTINSNGPVSVALFNVNYDCRG